MIISSHFGHPLEINGYGPALSVEREAETVMKRLNAKATIVMDFIHVLEYLWKAAWCFFDKGEDAVEDWIAEKSVNILNDRLDITGARWSLQGAEVILKLRSLKKSITRESRMKSISISMIVNGCFWHLSLCFKSS